MSGKTRVLGGITLIDTPLVTRAMDHAWGHSEPFLFNHAVRSWLFAVRLGQLQGITHDMLDGTGDIRLESIDRASGYWTTLADTHSSVNMRTAGVYWRAEPGDMETLDGRDDEKRADLIAERLRQWKSVTKV